ncbi:hypothetical protein [Geomicrobium sediminis]|uniref:Uncharacterized protein n=1 Tax=Geomicrobium sediminis TaxID=1347788 RepID=A0ABS2P7T6_9BACL|nr:hypothetical protein [Geomicrobium sediminis]MBM7631071.1 hypothetical protein [Geomicrobium sediminis]
MTKNAWVHIGFFILLVFLSVFSFFYIFGSGFGGSLNASVFIMLAIFSILWSYTYIKQIHLSKSYYYVISGSIIVYNIFLSTLFWYPENWLYIGTPIIMLAGWYILILLADKKYASHWSVLLLVIIISIYYAWDITRFYYEGIGI